MRPSACFEVLPLGKSEDQARRLFYLYTFNQLYDTRRWERENPSRLPLAAEP